MIKNHPEAKKIGELLPFSDESVAEVYRAAETSSSDDILLPNIPMVGVVLRSIIFEGTSVLSADYDDSSLKDPSFVNQGETLFTGRLRRSVLDHSTKDYTRLIGSFGNSLITGLAVEKALENEWDIYVAPDEEGFNDVLGRVFVHAADPDVSLFEFTNSVTGIDTLRIAEGYAHRIVDRFTDLNPGLAQQVPGTRNALGLGMVAAYLQSGGE